jgi:hypothetical protein
MIGQILEHADLAQATGYQRRADIEACLKRQGVRYFYGRRGLWTTQEALNEALGIRPVAGNDDHYRPEDVLS